MNKSKLEKFKNLLIHHRDQILNGSILNSKEELIIQSDDLSDEGDIANNLTTQNINLSMKDREFTKLQMINQALERVKNKSYGSCEDCGEDIEEKRLSKQPWTSLCIEHAEELERNRIA